MNFLENIAIIIQNRMRNYLRFSLLISLSLIFSSSIFANNQQLDSAQFYYENGNYESAIASYNRVLESDEISPEIYFNLGNCYFKMDNIPSAILYYEKAKKIEPNNEDLEYNLNVANSRIADRIEPVPEMLHLKLMRSISNSLDADSWAWLFIGLFILFLLFLAIYLISRRRGVRKFGFTMAALFLLFSIISFAISRSEHNFVKTENSAIIFEPSVTIKSSPNKSSKDLFVLHDGTKLQLLEKVGDWYKIRIASGSVGWIEADKIRVI